MTARTFTFTVHGQPAAQGSMRVVGNNRIIHGDQGQLDNWRTMVGYCATQTRQPIAPKPDPVSLILTFRVPRPKSHRPPKQPAYPSMRGPQRADLDKYIRAVCDALEGIVYEDDAQVIRVTASKIWATGPDDVGATITVLTGSQA